MDTSNIADRIRVGISDRLSLPEVFRRVARARANSGMRYVSDDGGEELLSYSELLAAAQQILGGLRAAGLVRGDKVVIQLDNELHFAVVFWAALLGGYVAVPLGVPASFHPRDAGLHKLQNVYQQLGAGTVVVIADAMANDYAACAQRCGITLRTVCLGVLRRSGPLTAWSPGAAEDTALLMYSSGSTGQAKGVILSHANLLHNLAQIAQRSALVEEDLSVTWLPYTHDMGLILFHLAHCVAGINQIKVSSLAFMKNPLAVLQLIDQHRATLTGQPNFAFDHILRRVSDAQIASLDLSSLRLIYNGAEPISVELCQQFTRRFKGAKLSPEVLSPGYGIAEACVCATQHAWGGALDREVCPTLYASRRALSLRGQFEPVSADDTDALPLVNLGPPMPGMAIRVVGEDGKTVPERRVGALQICGPNVSSGYYGVRDDPRVLPGGWLDTGDLGFMVEGNVCIAGRKKDVIFINGQNFYAHDLEQLVCQETGLPSAQVAVCGYRAADQRQERVALLVRGQADEATLHRLNRAKALIASTLNFEVFACVLLAALPRTSSGKLQRFTLVEQLQRGDFDQIAATVASRMAAVRTVIAPATTLEQVLLAHCVEGSHLAPAQASVESSFVELVGDSLRLAELLLRLRSARAHPDCGRLRLRDLHEHDTVRALANALQGGHLFDDSVAPLRAVAGQRHPLSRSQQDLWVLQQLSPQGTHYHEVYCCEIAQTLDLARFKAALAHVLASHSALRTRFVPTQTGFPEQLIEAQATLDFSYFDLAAINATQRPAQFDQHLNDLAGRAFDLAAQAPCRFALLRTGRDRYTFFIGAHHLVIDGWGFRQFFLSLQQAYGAQGAPAPEPLRPVDYFAWVASRRLSPEYSAARNHWQRLVNPPPPRLELGASAAPPGATRVHTCHLDRSCTEHLHLVARAWGVTPYQLALSGYLLLLARVCGEPDVAVGITVAGRSEPAALPILGYLANTLMVRIDVRQWRTSFDLAKEVARQVQAALRFQDFALSEFVAGVVGGERPEPLYAAAFSLLESPTTAPGPLVFGAGKRLRGGAKLDLVLNLETATDGWVCYWEYDAARIATHDIDDWHQKLLSGWAAMQPRGESLLNRLRLEPSAVQGQAQRLLQAPRQSPRYPVVTDYFEAQAERCPQRLALTCGQKVLSYGELRAQVDTLAATLRQAGVCPQTYVMVWLPKSIEMVVATLAVLKAGAAYVPCDTEYPAQRVQDIAATARPLVLLSVGQCLLGLDISTLTVQSIVCLDAWPDALARPANCAVLEVASQTPGDSAAPPGRVPRTARPDDPVYVHFTSGTTGEPKGIVNSQRSVCHLIEWYVDQGIYREGDHIAQLVSCAFEAFVGELFPALAVGATLHILPPLKTVAPSEVLQCFAERGISVATLSPSYALQLFRAEASGTALPALRTLMFGGEALLPSHVAMLRDALPAGVVLINAYGPTEATVHATCYHIPADSTEVCIGTPLPGKRVLVVDRCNWLCAPGEAGELWIGGEGLAMGYLHDAVRSARAFVNFELRPGKFERFYRTGDLGVMDARGQLHFLGRLDNQVKINGQRVELEAVEAALAAHPAVRGAVVVADPFRAGQLRLVAFYCAATELEPQSIVEFLRRSLVAYMVPTRFVQLAELPKSANTKLDRKALAQSLVNERLARAPAPQPSIERKQPNAMQTQQLQTTVAQAWQAVLGVAVVEHDSNFFTVGGDSILALELVSTLARNGLRLAPKDVFSHPTLAAQVALLAAQPHTEAATEPDQAVCGSVPLTPIQHWFFAQNYQHPNHWHQSIELALDFAVDPDALRRALKHVLNSHDQLRAGFTRRRQGVQQFVREPDRDDEAGADLVLAATDGEGALPALRAQLATSIDLATRVCALGLAQLGDARYRLVWVMHHLVVDHVSWRILVQDLQSCYAQAVRGEAPSLPRRTSAYRSYADRLEAQAAERQTALGHYARWRGVVTASARAGFDPWPEVAAAELPLSSFETHVSSLELVDTAALLATFAPHRRVQVQDALLAALLRALGRWLGRADVALDLESHGRTDPGEGIDLTRSVGWFTSLYPAHFSELDQTNPLSTLRRVCQARVELPAQGVGFGVLRYLCAEPELVAALDAYRAPVINFNYLGQTDRPHTAQGWPLLPSEVANFALENHAPYKLIVQAYLRAGQLQFELSASQRVASSQQLAALAHLLRQEIAILVDAAQQNDFVLRSLDFELMSLSDAALARLPRDAQDVYPMSAMQEAMFFHTVTNPDSALYHEQTVYRAAEQIDCGRLQTALADMVARHEMLRTVFQVEADAPPLQIVLAHGQALVQQRALAADGDEAAHRIEIAHYLEQERREGRFDLGAWPLFRLTLFSGQQTSYLAFSFHHILLDGWSQASFMAELYRACRADAAHGSLAPPLASHFKDHLKRLQAQAARPDSQAFWKARLHGMVYNELPLDAKRAPQRQFIGEKVHRLLDVAAVARIETLARKLAVTVNSVCLAAFTYFLHTLSGDQDIVTGVVTSGRFADLPDATHMLGCFLNTVPFRLHCDSGAATLTTLTGAASEFLNAAREHEQMPLKDILRLVQPLAAAREPFNNIYAFENYPSSAAADQGLELIDGYDMTNFDLTTVLVKRGDSLRVMFEYAPDVIGAPTAQRWLGQFCHMLAVLSEQPDALICELDLLPPEQHLALRHYNATARDYPLEVRLHDLFVRQAQCSPNRVAVDDGTEQFDYARLDDESNRLAWSLTEVGIGANDFVAVMLPRCAQAVVGFLGVLKAGGAYVPIDPSYPIERIRTIVNDARAKAIVTMSGVLADAQLGLEGWPTVQRIVLLDDAPTAVLPQPHAPLLTRSDWMQRPHTALPVRCAPTDLAYVIYTSGSTGRPKGVMIRHRSAVNTILGINDLFDVGEADKVLCFSSFCFDLSVYDLFGTLARGAAMVLASEAHIREPEQMFELMAQTGVTVWNSVPTGMNQLVGTLLLRPQPPSLASLRLVMLSGEFIALGLPAEIARVFPNARCISLGGATEGSIWSIYFPIGAMDPNWRSIPYGYPLPNQGYYVLTEGMKHCLVDQVGMLYIVGDGVAQGYFNDADKTALAFVPDPFRPAGAPFIYRTGDLGRMRAAGVVEILGRADLQVKVRGYRIELGEIESQLSLMPGLRESAAVVTTDGGYNSLVAFYVTDDEALAGEQIKAHLQTLLPDYMLPAQFLRAERLPVNASGKLDRKQLLAMLPAMRASVTSEHHELPRNELERHIAEVWQSVLRIERVGVHDNFFFLGGDSILCLQVAAGLAQRQIEIRPSDLFKRPTIAHLAEFLEHREAAERCEVVQRVGPLALAPIQRWFLRELRPVRPAYWHLSMELEICEEVEHGRLAAALLAVVNHHDVLRCRLTQPEGPLTQQAAFEQVDVSRCDLAEVAEDGRRGESLAAFGRQLREAISLTEGHLFGVGLARLGVARYRLIWVAHHLLVDGVSWRILLEDLQRLYRDPQAALPPKTSAYGAWTELVQQSVAEQGALALEPWQPHQHLLARLRIADPRDVRNTEAQALTQVRKLDASRTRQLLSAANLAYRTDVQDLLVAALVRSFWALTGQTDCVVHLEHHGRTLGEDRLDLSRTVGWFTAIYPLVVEFGPDADPADLIAAVKDNLRRIGRRAPYYMAAARSSQGQDELGGALGGDVLFNYLGNLDRIDLDSGWNLAEPSAPDRAGENRRSHVLDVSAHIADGCLHIQASAVPALLLQTGFGLKRWIDAFEQQLVVLLDHCVGIGIGRKTSSDFPLLLPDHSQLRHLQDNVADAYPLSAMQEGMYFNSRAYPGAPMYHVHAGATLRAKLDVPRLEDALNRVAEVTEMLRTIFVTEGFERPIQIVLERVRYRIEVLEHVTADDVFASLGEDVLDMSRWPNMVFKVIRLGEDTYQLVQFFHHLLMDGWSNAILFTRIMEEYEHLLQARQTGSVLPPPQSVVASYGEFVAYQRAAANQQAAETFWRDYLAGAELLELPLDHAPSEPRRFVTKIGDYRLEGALRLALRAKARDLNCTVSDLLLTVYAALLHVLTGRTDLVIGYSASIRPAAITGAGEMVGMFLNTVPLRVPVALDCPFIENTFALSESHTRCREFEEFPLPKILRAVREANGPANDVLFRVLYTSEVYPGARLAEGMQGLGHHQWHMTEFDFALVYSGESEDSIHIKLAYAPDLFEADTIEGWFELYRELCLLLVGAAQPSLAEFKRARLAAALPVAAAVSAVSFLTHFKRVVAEQGEAIAVQAGRSLSYRALDAQSQAVAHTLAGVPPGPVLLDVQDDAALYVSALVGCLKAGRAFVPVAQQPTPQLMESLGAIGAGAVITDHRSRWRERAVMWGQPLRLLGRAEFEVAREHAPDTGRLASEQGDMTAYMLFTSGSTGAPKCVRIGVPALDHFVDWYVRTSGLMAGERVSHLMARHFDASLSELLPALAVGATVCADTTLAALSFADLERYVHDQGVTVLTLPADYFGLWMGQRAAQQTSPRDQFTQLRLLALGGSPLRLESVARWQRLTGRAGQAVPVLNVYGLTEATVASCAYLVDRPLAELIEAGDVIEQTGLLPVGRNGAGLQVIDAALRARPHGVGQVVLCGSGLMSDYLDDGDGHAVTLEQADGRRWLRTGDTALLSPSGLVTVLGRSDRLLKVRGYRIDPLMIERMLLRLPGVVATVIDVPANGRLTAHCVLSNDSSTAIVRAMLVDMLPPYLVPLLVRVPRIALNGSGKPDRQATAALAWPATPQACGVADESRAMLAELVERLLKQPVEPESSFFALGGDSLLAAVLVDQIAARFGVTVELGELVRAASFRELADLVAVRLPGREHPPTEAPSLV